MFGNSYSGKRVFVTGHTGFKGSWLCLWLTEMGAEVFGYALEPETIPSHYSLLSIPMQSKIADIRDNDHLSLLLDEIQPEIIFHLAAQPLVRRSYQDPAGTFASNVMGTVYLLNACRQISSVRAVINVTSDKCYDNQEWIWGYRECDPIGGFDPYSASKGCSELVTAAYRNSFFPPKRYGETHHLLLASARAGNVIGGGDWAEDRLIPDIMRATKNGKTTFIRNPQAIRPWQHVLEPLSGYLLLGQRLLEGRKDCAEAWNFGPNDDGAVIVEDVVRAMQKRWGRIEYTVQQSEQQPHEANLLKLDCSKARRRLNWKGVWNKNETFQKTTDWYRAWYEDGRLLTSEQMTKYIQDAAKAGLLWAV